MAGLIRSLTEGSGFMRQLRVLGSGLPWFLNENECGRKLLEWILDGDPEIHLRMIHIF